MREIAEIFLADSITLGILAEGVEIGPSAEHNKNVPHHRGVGPTFVARITAD